MAWVVFLMVKLLNKLRRDKNEPEAPAATPEDIQLLREIRDELKTSLIKEFEYKTVPSVPFYYIAFYTGLEILINLLNHS